MKGLTGNLLASVVTARVVSSVFNFVTNRHLVFARGYGRASDHAPRYFALVAAIMMVNYASIYALYETLGAGLLPSKLLTEAALFITSYQVQKRFVFTKKATHSTAIAASESADLVPAVEPVRAAGRASGDGGSSPSSRLARRA
jgi:putative flippase GtrA